MKDCHCGSGLQYDQCCGPYIGRKVNALTAEALMRSRYSAYVEHEIGYIVETCVNRGGKDDIDYKSTKEWSEKSRWLGLKIVSVEKGGREDSEGVVEFEAAYERDGLKDLHKERATFKKENGKWLYAEGEVAPHTMVRTAPKVGRNDPCPCGSGRKYKHCCYGKG
ncbi:MAG: YchJ family protein [Treponema sp.]|nr:YchJ family protein [Treponema sp.]